MKIFTYRLVYLPDSTNTSYTKEEDFYLQVLGNKSCFVNSNFKYVVQSIQMMEASKTDIATMMSKVPSFPKTSFKSVVYKEGNDVSVYDKQFSLGMKYKETSQMKWKLLGESKKIDNYNCQKATVSYGGRNWVAWFTNEIPISDGPHTFHGLPGLIVQLYDSKSNFNFSLIQVETDKDYLLFYEKGFERYKEVSKKEFFETRINIKNNYVNNMESRGFTFKTEDKAAIQKKIDSKKDNYIELIP
jgi:GLPGLI family protein